MSRNSSIDKLGINSDYKTSQYLIQIDQDEQGVESEFN